MVAEYSFDYNLIQKNGKEYFDTNITPKATYKLEELSIRLDNLFNGDKALGKITTQFSSYRTYNFLVYRRQSQRILE